MRRTPEGLQLLLFFTLEKRFQGCKDRRFKSGHQNVIAESGLFETLKL
jgi:hypothetical protein